MLDLLADGVDLVDFESDLFSKHSKNLKKIIATLHMEGKDLEINSYAIQDSLNIVLSSFYLEDLLTSKGKEQFKKSLIKYLKERYRVKVDYIYIIKLTQVESGVDIDKLVEALKESGFVQKRSKSIKESFDMALPEK